MIDTIKFKIPIDNSLYLRIKKKAIYIEKHDNEYNRTLFKFYRSDVRLGSYSKSVNLFMLEDDPTHITIEFSLPKFYFGHNVYLMYKNHFKPCLNQLHEVLEEQFGVFPQWNKWEIVRLDICYAWKFQKDSHADTALSVVRQLNFPRQKRYQYDSSVMWKGEIHSSKFYLKHDEFYKHDFKELLKIGKTEFAYNTLLYSTGVLRYEVTMRQKALKSYFKVEHLYPEDINFNFIKLLLRSFLYKLTKNYDNEFMNSQEVYKKLLEKYSSQKAAHLWQFWKIYHSNNPEDQQILKKAYDRTTIYRNLRDISKAGVGLPTKDIDIDFALDIPSEYAVNSEALDSSVEEPGEQQNLLDIDNG